MDNSREQILKTSLKLFLQKGYKGVTMQEIVKQAGFSKGTFYYYFNSKEKVFEEVLDFFLSKIVNRDYSKLPHDTLKEFYTAYLKDSKERVSASNIFKDKTGESINMNPYYLVFDALKILPSFKEKNLKRLQYELSAWKKIISIARSKGEIVSQMRDEQIAKIFILLGDGLVIYQRIIKGSVHKSGELKSLYDGFYNSLKP